MGRRIAKRINGTIIEKYFWQSMTRLLAVYDGSNNLIMRFTYADGRMPVSMTKNGVTYYLAYDQIGSLRAVMDASGSVTKEMLYDSFGAIIFESNSDFIVPFGFAGGLHDRDTGLVRFGYRDYDPTIGRWVAKDPIDFAAGDVNLFGYVATDPVNWIDLSGKIAAQVIGGIIGAGFGAYAAIHTGQDLSGVLQSTLVGAVAGVLSTIPIPGINPLLSGIAMGGVSGSLGNLGAQLASNNCNQGIDWDSAMISGMAGAFGGLAGSAIAGITNTFRADIQ